MFPRQKTAGGGASATFEGVAGKGLRVQVAALARYGYSVRAQAISRMREDRRIATLLAVARDLEVRATDDALDLFNVLVRDLLSQAQSQGRIRRLRTLQDLDAAALQLCEVYRALMDPAFPDLKATRAALFGRIPAEELARAVETVQALAQPKEGRHYEDLVRRYQTARRVLLPLLETIELKANHAVQPILDALSFLSRTRAERRTRFRDDEVPLAVLTPAWRRLVHPSPGEVDRRAYTLCTLERLREALARHDIFVDKSRHWGDPRAQLLTGSAWKAAQSRVCRMLRLSPGPDEELTLLRQELDQAYRRTAGRLLRQCRGPARAQERTRGARPEPPRCTRRTPEPCRPASGGGRAPPAGGPPRGAARSRYLDRVHEGLQSRERGTRPRRRPCDQCVRRAHR